MHVHVVNFESETWALHAEKQLNPNKSNEEVKTFPRSLGLTRVQVPTRH